MTTKQQLDYVVETITTRTERLVDQLIQAGQTTTAQQFPDRNGASQLRELRAAMPRRPLRFDEGLRIAERQADLLRWQLGRNAAGALPTHALTALPFLAVTERMGLAKSALLTTTERGWVLVLRAEEPQVRKRFSMCHELKHLLDDELATQLPDGLYPPYSGYTAADLAERVCDHFAGALLMPKLLLRRDWTSGLQDTRRLAHRYQVSKQAMDVRLLQLGLREPVPRCAGIPNAR